MLTNTPTSFQGPVFHWAGQGTLLQGLRLSGRSPRQYLLCTERLVPSWSGWRQRTVRSWYPALPQLRLQCSHSSAAQLWEREGAVRRTASRAPPPPSATPRPFPSSQSVYLLGNNFLTMDPTLGFSTTEGFGYYTLIHELLTSLTISIF